MLKHNWFSSSEINGNILPSNIFYLVIFCSNVIFRLFKYLSFWIRSLVGLLQQCVNRRLQNIKSFMSPDKWFTYLTNISRDYTRWNDDETQSCSSCLLTPTGSLWTASPAIHSEKLENAHKDKRTRTCTHKHKITVLGRLMSTWLCALCCSSDIAAMCILLIAYSMNLQHNDSW